MCQAISAVKYQDKWYTFTNMELNTKEGRKLAKEPGFQDDKPGHGIIRKYWGIPQGQGTEFEYSNERKTQKTIPPEIKALILAGAYRGFGTPTCLLSATGNDKWRAEKAAINAKWRAEIDAINAKWRAEIAPINDKWGAEIDPINAKWNAEKAAINDKWDAEIDAIKAKWDAEKAAINDKWDAERDLINDKWRAEIDPINAKWDAEIAPIDDKWDAEKDAINDKWDAEIALVFWDILLASPDNQAEVLK